MIRTLIADDEWEYSKNIINNVVNKIKDIKIEYIATDGKEALDAIVNNPFDLILLDLNMPKMNGLELIEEICKLNMIRIPKVIIISGELPLIRYATSNKIISNIILKADGIENIYKKILQTVNDIRYENNYDIVKEKTILTLKKWDTV